MTAPAPDRLAALARADWHAALVRARALHARLTALDATHAATQARLEAALQPPARPLTVGQAARHIAHGAALREEVSRLTIRRASLLEALQAAEADAQRHWRRLRGFEVLIARSEASSALARRRAADRDTDEANARRDPG